MKLAGSLSSSKVVIQCTDPANLLGPFESRLSSQVPLRNLHWKSPSRPLRSIPSLNILLTRDDRTQNGAQPAVRRHQIPGLRETPYVKLYLLRCDDKEAYKEKARKEIRQWIKDNTSTNEGKNAQRNQEQHDASEWLVVHIVLPETHAAAQLKSSKHISLEATDSTDSVNSKSKWTGKSTSTIYDKLRADFSSSSKDSIHRVAQIRITEPGKPQGALSTADLEEQWQDLVENLKACILRSFDARVAQYEEDISERHAQRSLPGWNFCTFFVLKEGLARGFERVGLLVDALAVYDELETELDTVIKDQANQDDIESSGALLPYSNDLKSIIRAAIDFMPSKSVDTKHLEQSVTLKTLLEAERERFPFNIERRKYRDLILSNQVSALDFRIYIFTKKLELLRRQAIAPASLSFHSDFKSKEQVFDVNVMADLAEQALQFINQAAREFRRNLYMAWGGRLSGDELSAQKTVIANVVATWEWAAIAQILSACLTVLNLDLEDVQTWDQPSKRREGPHDIRLGSESERASSSEGKSSASETSNPQRIDSDYHIDERVESSSHNRDSTSLLGQGHGAKMGMDQLATWTARLLLLARRVLEDLSPTWALSSPLKITAIALQSPRVPEQEPVSAVSRLEVNRLGAEADAQLIEHGNLNCLESPTLKGASRSQETFNHLFSLLSKHAHRLFSLANDTHASRQVMIDLARLAHGREDYRLAGNYLGVALNGLPQQVLGQIHPHVLDMYANCLQHLEQPYEYLRCLIACLQMPPVDLSESVRQRYGDKLCKAANSIDPLTIPLTQLIDVCRVDRSISHYSDKDGFSLSVTLQSRSGGKLSTTGSMRLTLVAANEADPSAILLLGARDVCIDSVKTSFNFGTTCSTQGWYDLRDLEIEIGNLQLIHHFHQNGADNDLSQLDFLPMAGKLPSVMVYPRVSALAVRMTPARVIELTQPRRMTITLDVGSNDISKCFIRLRAATAGLRLQVYDAAIEQSTTDNLFSIEILRDKDVSAIKLANIQPGSTLNVNVPYTLENFADSSVTVKTEVEYETAGERCWYYQTSSVNVILPLSVNMQDFYMENYTFLRFTISPATLVPIYLLDCAIEEVDDIEAETGRAFKAPVLTYPKEPASWTVRLRKKTEGGRREKHRLMLIVNYQCLDELILYTLEQTFLDDLRQSAHTSARRILTSHLLEKVQTAWTEQDLEFAGLTRETEIWNIRDMDWKSILSAFDSSTKRPLSEWLISWHNIRKCVALDPTLAPLHQLRLSVDLPTRPPMVLTELKTCAFQHRSNSAIVGQPLVVELLLLVMFSPNFGDGISPDVMDLTYELVAQSDIWLIGVERKEAFQLQSKPREYPSCYFPNEWVICYYLPLMLGVGEEMELIRRPLQAGLISRLKFTIRHFRRASLYWQI